MNDGLIFIRNETVDFESGRQTYFSPFEAFIQRANEQSLPIRFILPVTDRNAHFENRLVEQSVAKVGSARGFFRGMARAPEILRTALRLRYEFGYRTVVVRLPEHFSMLLLPLLTMFGFRVVVWLVHDRRNVLAADQEQRASLRSRLAGMVSGLNGMVESLYLNRVPTISNGTRLAEKYCGANPNVEVVYSTLLNQKDFQDLGASATAYVYQSDCIRLIFAGRVSVEKGIDNLLDFFEILRVTASQRGVRCELSLVGKVDDTMRQYLDDRLAQMVNPENVKTLGFVRRGPELWNAYGKSDFFCLLSKAEGTPRVVPEAHAAGLPVLISPEANSDDIVVDSELVIDRKELQSSAEKLVALYCDEARYTAMRTRLLNASKVHSLDALIEKFSNLTEAERTIGTEH